MICVGESLIVFYKETLCDSLKAFSKKILSLKTR